MGVNLTPGAITKIMTDKCSSTDLKPVVQVTDILSGRISTKNDKQCYRKIVLSDGSSSHFGCIADDICISNKLQKGSIVQLTKFHFTKFSINGNIRVLLINDLKVIHTECDLIGNPESFPCNDTPLVERSTSPIPDEDHVDISQAQKSMTSTQKCSETQSRKRKHQSSNETPESDTNEDVDNSHDAQEPSATKQKTMMEKNKQDDVGACFKKLEALEEDVSKMARMAMEKNKEDDVGACFKKLETLEKDISKVIHTECDLIGNPESFPCNDTPLVERSTSPIPDEDHVDISQAQKSMTSTQKCSETQSRKRKHQSSNETPESDTNEDVDNSHDAQEPSATKQKTMMEKNKQDDVGACFKKLEALEEDVSKMARMAMEKNKEDDVGACFKKLETLEKDISKVTRMMMEKDKEDDVRACFKKLETLEEDVSKLTRMVMGKDKEDDMGACIEKLDKMGWGAEEPIYDTALLLFGQSADYRKLWLHLKPASCGKWVKNAGSMFGLLD
ncbi:hypothetical protein CTI12_AA628750 [Artemisia annua]|uniref:Replication factor-A protein 1 N-terminal domain-containing protein n=1 Tax=Artemisia annua TaxID=35608 RepID=A0A2U1K9I6_ARTAN|nr:hypothetical protein CTI12_AA628750 [Artemisia annua]